MNFKVVNGNDTEDYDKFKGMYLNPKYKKNQIMDEFDIGDTKYRTWSNRVIQETGYKRYNYGRTPEIVKIDGRIV